MPKILKKAEVCGILLVLDECFLDFTGQEKARSWKPYLNEYPNLVLLKSFTKLFAMPGIRLGYLLTANEALICQAEQAGQAWGMSCVAESAGIAAAKAHDDWAAQTSRAIRPLREKLKTGLEALGFSVKTGRPISYAFMRRVTRIWNSGCCKNRSFCAAAATMKGWGRRITGRRCGQTPKMPVCCRH